MTTVLADAKLGVMVSDSNVCDGDRNWSEPKVFKYRGALYGFSGTVSERIEFMAWIKGGDEPKFSHSYCLKLTSAGLFVYDCSTTPTKVVRGIESIGSGGKAAMCAYEALGFKNPSRAVHIACKHDPASRTPVRVHKLNSST